MATLLCLSQWLENTIWSIYGALYLGNTNRKITSVIYVCYITHHWVGVLQTIFFGSRRADEIWWNITQPSFNSQLLIIALVTKYLTWTCSFPRTRLSNHWVPCRHRNFQLIFIFNAFVTMNEVSWAKNDWYDQKDVWTLERFFVLFFKLFLKRKKKAPSHTDNKKSLHNLLTCLYRKCLLDLMKEKWSSTAYHINTVLGFPRENFLFVSRWFFFCCT